MYVVNMRQNSSATMMLTACCALHLCIIDPAIFSIGLISCCFTWRRRVPRLLEPAGAGILVAPVLKTGSATAPLCLAVGTIIWALLPMIMFLCRTLSHRSMVQFAETRTDSCRVIHLAGSKLFVDWSKNDGQPGSVFLLHQALGFRGIQVSNDQARKKPTNQICITARRLKGLGMGSESTGHSHCSSSSVPQLIY